MLETRRMHSMRSIAISALAALGGCAGFGIAEQEPVTAPLLEDIGEALIFGIADEPIRLEGGRWEGMPYAPGGASRPMAGLAEDFIRHGDLDGDGNDESVVLAWTSSGGSGTLNYIAVFAAGDAEPVNVGTAPLGDRVQLIDASVTDRVLAVDVVQHGDDDAACCPTLTARRTFVLDGGTLLERDATTVGTLSLETPGGVDWQLVSLGPAPERAPEGITLRIDGNRISGRGPCNRYFTQAVPGGGPADFTVERIGATRMFCDEETMALEDAYFAALASSRRFAFRAGRLVITYEADGALDALLFSR